MFHQYPITPVIIQLLIQNLWQNIYCADLFRYLYWGSGWVAIKHTAMIYWSVWNEVASEAANARRKFWSSSVSLRRRKISKWKGHSLYLEGDVSSVMSDSFVTPWTVAHQRFPGKNTGVSCCFFHQGIFLTRGSNPCLLHLLPWQMDSLPLTHLGSFI